MKDAEFKMLAVRPTPAPLNEQVYISRMARSLVGSLGAEEAKTCVGRLHWEGLRPLVMAEDPVMCSGL